MQPDDWCQIAICAIAFLAYAKARITQLTIRNEDHGQMDC